MFGFPWSNFHELNLDWILNVVKDAKEIFVKGESDIQNALETANQALETAEQAASAVVADGSITIPKMNDSVLKMFAFVVSGSVNDQFIPKDSFVIVRKSTISGISDGIYQAAGDIPASSILTSGNLKHPADFDKGSNNVLQLICDAIESGLLTIVNGDNATAAIPSGGIAFIKNNEHGLTPGFYTNISGTTYPTSGGTANSSTFTRVYNVLNRIQKSINAFKIIHVIPDGSGDYTTISAAVAAAADDDIIIVHEGTYQESVKASGKDISIIGIDRYRCVLQYSGLDYDNPPLEMAKGLVKNLTINCLTSGTPGNYRAYCVHIDFNSSANETLRFENVRFYNPVHQAVGIGLRPHFTLSFVNCEFQAIDQAALYCHDFETPDTTQDLSNQWLYVENCILINNSANKATIMLQSQELSTECAQAVFIGNSVENYASDNEISMTLWAGRTLTNNSYLGSSD